MNNTPKHPGTDTSTSGDSIGPTEGNTEQMPGMGISGITRAAVGGALMGLANLVPGISGGTMLVATGIYTQFIDAISDVTRLKLTKNSVLLLGTVVLFAVIAMGAFSGIIASLLETSRWAMYSLFIGLTWGGAPLLWRMIRESGNQSGTQTASESQKTLDGPVTTGFVAGVIIMAGLAVMQMTGATGGSSNPGIIMLVVGGIAGASAMILPGVSGAYLLLLLGLYDTIINAIKNCTGAAKVAVDQLRHSGSDRDIGAIFDQFGSTLIDQLGVVVPVGIGVVVGIAGVANILRFVLHRYERATLGVLLGLLVAAPAGLYPFREGVKPQIGDVIKGETLTTQVLVDDVKAKDWQQRTFTPSAMHLGGSFGLILIGLGATLTIDRVGRRKK